MPDNTTKLRSISTACEALHRGDTLGARSVILSDYAFAPPRLVPHTWNEATATRIFVRDGFIDRYSGDRVLFPPVLRLVSVAMPEEFPFHPNWKAALTHPAFWELAATVDHVVPRSRGGSGTDENLVTTSMILNAAKGNWTLEELRWTLREPGSLKAWDGLLLWFLDYTRARPALLKRPEIRRWHRAALQISTGQSRPTTSS